MSEFNRVIWDYIESHSTGEDEVLEALSRYTHLKVIHPRMLCGPVQGKFLEFISRMLRPERILEIGTYTGYSAICLARGLKENGLLTTIEINDELSAISSKFFAQAGLKKNIIALTGDAIQLVRDLEPGFDLVYLDGEKEQYSEYFSLVFPLVKKGGFILADNTLWDGKVTDPVNFRDPASQALRRFNEEIRHSPGVECIILPLRDGLSLIRKVNI